MTSLSITDPHGNPGASGAECADVASEIAHHRRLLEQINLAVQKATPFHGTMLEWLESMPPLPDDYEFPRMEITFKPAEFD